ncbi:MAG: protein kinase [Polyangiales bacterium]
MELPSPGTVVAGKYQLESLLGEGGMGAVYRARHLMMNSSVALKWLRADMAGNREARERLLREAQSAARIRHPNVVQVFDVDTHEGMPFIVMELLEGENLAEVIVRRELSTPGILRLLLGALHGLSAAHELGIVHRDIKPENIFVVKTRQHPEGVAKLLDFGVSKLDKLDPHSARLTQTGTAVGTPLYMPVEQLTASSDVDARADVYAFGVVLYHALSGELPFDAETFAGVVLNIATSKPRTLKQLRPELPTSLDKVVMKAMARRRDDRYPHVPALIEALRGVLDSLGQPTVAYANTLTPNPEEDSFDALLRHDRRRKQRVGIGLAVLAVIVTTALAWPRGGSQPVRPNTVEAPAALPEVVQPGPPVVAPVIAPAVTPATKPVAPKPSRAPRLKREPVEPAPSSKPAREAEVAPAAPLAPKKAPVGKSGSLLREDF